MITTRSEVGECPGLAQQLSGMWSRQRYRDVVRNKVASSTEGNAANYTTCNEDSISMDTCGDLPVVDARSSVQITPEALGESIGSTVAQTLMHQTQVC